MTELSEIQQNIARVRAERGFTDDPVRLLTLLVEEVGEVAGELKKTWSANYPDPVIEDIANEVADVAVLVCALATRFDIDLEDAIQRKFIDADSKRAWATAREGVHEFEITTERLSLRPWQPSDGAEFARMNADAEVMADLGGPISVADSDRKLQRFTKSFDQHAITRWVLRDRANQFVGYCGIVPVDNDHPLGAHYEIGWRLIRDAWGKGYASEAAQAALDDAFTRLGIQQVLAYTAADNLRSQRVMQRLKLERSPSHDFEKFYDDVGNWQALVWVATSSSDD